jgi:hypothetical protein
MPFRPTAETHAKDLGCLSSPKMGLLWGCAIRKLFNGWKLLTLYDLVA